MILCTFSQPTALISITFQLPDLLSSLGCNVYEPWAALLVGAGGGIGFIAVHHAMIRFKLDDPLGERSLDGIMFYQSLTS